jgi:hypothetical protein
MTPRWQILLLTVLTVALGGILWWQLQPPPPAPVPPALIPADRATPNQPLQSALIPDVILAYPAAQERNDWREYDFFGTCVGRREAFFWEYDKVLRLAGAPNEIVNFKFDYNSLDQSPQQKLIKLRNEYLEKVLSRVVQDFYKKVATKATRLIKSSQVLPDNMGQVKTFGQNETTGYIVYQGKHFGSFFDPIPHNDMLTLTICRISD